MLPGPIPFGYPPPGPIPSWAVRLLTSGMGEVELGNEGREGIEMDPREPREPREL